MSENTKCDYWAQPCSPQCTAALCVTTVAPATMEERAQLQARLLNAKQLDVMRAVHREGILHLRSRTWSPVAGELERVGVLHRDEQFFMFTKLGHAVARVIGLEPS